MSLELWLAFAAASTVLIIIPGPTVLIVVAYALGAGRRAALWTAGGVVAGDALVVTASVLGLGALLAASATAFFWLKLIGGAYLVWLGVSLWRAPARARVAAKGATDSGPRMGLNAFLVTATNPKGLIFFIAFLPQFVSPAAPSGPQLAILAATFTVIGGLNALAYALLAGGLRERLARPGALTWLNRAGGLALIAMGVFTWTARRI